MDGGRGAMLRRDAAIRERLFDGSFTEADVEWVKPRLRTANLLTRLGDGAVRSTCGDCAFNRPVVYGQAVVAASTCELDGVCWNAERDAIAEQRKQLPLWRLRKLNGKPNYRNASEQERFLYESGWLAWSAGARKGPDAGVAATSGYRTQKVEWPVPFEAWAETLSDPLRVPPADADRRLLAGWQIDLIDGEPLPIEKLAGVHPWRRWDGPGEPPKAAHNEDEGELDIEPLEASEIEEVAA